MTAERQKHRKGIIILTVIFAIIVSLLFLAWSGNTHLTKSRYEVVSSDLPESFDGYKILQISDLHDKEFGEMNARVLKAVRKEDPDMIALTGDMINSTDTPEDFVISQELLADLAEEFDVYYIDGNHETAMNVVNSNYYDIWIESIQKAGVKILDNEKVSVKKDGDTIDLFGLWFNGRFYNNMSDESKEKYFLDVDHIEKLIGSADMSRFNLLLTHNPVYFHEYAQWGADLTLAGHMHGGVIRVPFKGGLISPERVYWPEYDAGEFTVKSSVTGENDPVMIVNRGLGNGASGYRFLNWPDLSVITLKTS